MISQQLATPASPPATSFFSDRIKLLIQRVGSATEIARMCGFSEGVVRSWRDGNTDPSRARCVTLARTLGISLVWLVAGEGALQMDATASTQEEQRSSEKLVSHGAAVDSLARVLLTEDAMDTRRMDAAVRILQSELSMTDSRLSAAENADLLDQLYAILGPGGTHVEPLAMVAFNHALGERLRKARQIA